MVPVRVLQDVEAAHGEVVEPSQKELPQELGQLDTEHHAVGVAVNDLVDEGKQTAILDVTTILALQQAMVYAHEVVVYVEGKAKLRLLLRRREYVLLDDAIKIMGATATCARRAVPVDSGSQPVLHREGGCVLDDMVSYGQLVDRASLGSGDDLGSVLGCVPCLMGIGIEQGSKVILKLRLKRLNSEA